MAAFERVKSGIPSMDAALDNIRLGDNVVWQVSDLEEFRTFVDPYVEQAIADGRNLIYIRFASHEPIVQEQPGVRVISVHLSHLFETFAYEIQKIIEKEGRDAFYVFDCLSELQIAWSTDLMMGNFFRLTCPYLFSLDTVAFFPVIRGKHSFEAIAKIRDTTQLFLDVYSQRDVMYVRPMKVWNRYSATMFLPHVFNKKTGEFLPAVEGVETSRFYKLMNQNITQSQDQNVDSWERFFQQVAVLHQNNIDVREQLDRICEIMLTRDPKLCRLIKENFEPEDYFAIRQRMIGTGMIGGKATGMLLARKLIWNRRPDLIERLEPHDSFYIGSDVFYSYIVDNDFWDIRIRQHNAEEYFALADTMVARLMNGSFSAAIREDFRRMLDYYGNNPIIVRSSSILEDGFGNAFAGKYESVFCANQGSPEERLEELETAIRRVYASTNSLAALEYRARRGLDDKDEQMAILVQRVSGTRYDDFFAPAAAGVGYSLSPYRFSPEIDTAKGMLRLVMGLGTEAVDRTQSSYPRLVPLDQPLYKKETSSSARHRFSQREADVIRHDFGCLAHCKPEDVAAKMPPYLSRMLMSHDHDAERMFRNRGQRRDVLYVSCDGVVANEQLMNDMRDIMQVISEAYDYPVDIEYAINFSEEGQYAINLLQCRPLQVMKETESIAIPKNVDNSRVLLHNQHVSMGFSRRIEVDIIIAIDAMGYYQMPYQEKSNVARTIGHINWYFRKQKEQILLFTPGRIGTSSPELGVPTTFADLSEIEAIFEVSESRVGYMPELSYGSHIFQDLVEDEILYSAVFEDERTMHFDMSLLDKYPNLLLECDPKAEGLEDIVRVVRLSGEGCWLYYDMDTEELLIEVAGKN